MMIGKCLWIRALLAALFLLLIDPTLALSGGTTVNLSSYRVSITKVEFQRRDGLFSTFLEGDYTFDVASVDRTKDVGALAYGKGLDPGVYEGIRITFSRCFGIIASGYDNEQRFRTASSKGALFSAFGLENVSRLLADGLPAELQRVPLPKGAAMTTALTSLSIEETLDGTLQYYQPMHFELKKGRYILPHLRIDFNIEDIAEIRAIGTGQGLLVLLPPIVSVAILP